jgi:hypothetical protein
VFAAGLLVVALADVLIKHEHGQSGDEVFYSRMATHPGGPHHFPYAYRVGLPWLVHVLPFSQIVSFTLISWLAMAAASAALYVLMRDYSIDPRLAAGLALGFLLSPSLLVVLVRHGRSIDPLSELVMVLGVLFTVRRQRVALAVTVLLGTTIRESSLFLLPFAYAVWADGFVDRQALRDVVLVAIGPVLVYIVLRTSIDAVGRQYIPGYTGPFFEERWDMISSALSGGTLKVELRRLAIAYGPIWLLAPLALRTLPLARAGLVLVALCLASFTFAYDWGRIIFLAAPVFYVGAAFVVRDRRRLALLTIAVLLCVDVGYGIYLQVHGVASGIDSTVGHGIPVY